MHGWPNWVYTAFAYLIRAALLPIVLPVRMVDWLSNLKWSDEDYADL